MKISILGSGSGGNATFVEIDGIKILIDAGFSGKKIEEKLLKIEEKIKEIEGILITHEHLDHIQGAGIISRKYNLKLYITKESYSICEKKLGKIKEENLIFIDKERIIIKDRAVVYPFDVMHDAVRTVGFRIEGKDSKKVLSMSTDIGYINNIARNFFKNSDVIIIESNYDYQMLMACDYPWDLKDRVKSKRGHLSNNEAAKFICETYNKRLKKVYLAHVSKDSNKKEIVHKTILDELNRFKIEVPIEIASQDVVTKLYKI